ncbi:Uncharacterised protein [Halioglobus japonicus]|nr:Uncharacterised protein [Halioglobus japonicus]
MNASEFVQWASQYSEIPLKQLVDTWSISTAQDADSVRAVLVRLLIHKPSSILFDYGHPKIQAYLHSIDRPHTGSGCDNGGGDVFYFKMDAWDGIRLLENDVEGCSVNLDEFKQLLYSHMGVSLADVLVSPQVGSGTASASIDSPEGDIEISSQSILADVDSASCPAYGSPLFSECQGFRLWKMLPYFTKILWEDRIGESLRNEFSAKELRHPLADHFDISATAANYLRLVTSDSVTRHQGSGRSLSEYVVPLILILWDSNTVSCDLYNMDRAKRKSLIKDVSGLTPGEVDAVVRIATPEIKLQSGTKANTDSTERKVSEASRFIGEDITENELKQAYPLYRELLSKLREVLPSN